MPDKSAQVGIVFQQAVVGGEPVPAGGRCLQHRRIRNAVGKIHVREQDAALIRILRSAVADVGELEAQIQVQALGTQRIMGHKLQFEGRFFPVAHGLQARTQAEVAALAHAEAQGGVRNGVEFLLGIVTQVGNARTHIVQELGSGIALNAKPCLPFVVRHSPGVLAQIIVRCQHVGILQIGRKLAALIRIEEVCTYIGIGPYSPIGLVGSVPEELVFLQGDIAVMAHVGVVAAVQVQAEVILADGVPNHVHLRVETIPRPGLQIEGLFARKAGRRPHLHQVRIELVGTLVGRALDAVVKVQVELKHRIRQLHQLVRLLDAGGLHGVNVGYLHHGVQVLGVCVGAHKEGR